MASEILRPLAALNTEWDISTVGRINNTILYGEAGDGVAIQADKNDDNETQLYSLDDLVSITTAKTLSLNVLSQTISASGGMIADILPGGGSPIISIVFADNDTDIWKRKFLTVDLPDSSINGLEIQFRTGTVGGLTFVRVDEAYLEVFDVRLAKKGKTRIIPVL